MTDLMVWGGPVYCDTLKGVQWQRPTQIWCNPLEGMSNDAFWQKLAASGDPYTALLAAAKFAEVPGSIGLAGFSAFHEWCSPFLEAVGDRVSYVHLADSCFQGPGATKGKPGYVRFARLAAEGAVRMTVTSNGPWDQDISYMGPVGSKYEGRKFSMTSGSKCVLNFIREAIGDIPEVPFEQPPGVTAPERMFRQGELYWAHYPSTNTKDPHGVHIKYAAPYVQLYGVPWMAGQRDGSGQLGGGLGGASAQDVAKALIVLGALGLAGWASWSLYRRYFR